MTQPYVCPATFSGSLDNFLRRIVHKPGKILQPYVKENMTALDMGCGPGYFTAEMARLVGEGGRVIAADLQQAMLDKMMKKIKSSGLEKRVGPHLCQPDRTGLTTKADFILVFWMAHEVPDQQKFFGELVSLLNTGGRILVSEPKIHVTKSDFSAMVSRLESAGLQITGHPQISLSRSLVLKAKTEKI
jgi:ubiquinone/menaquinone biosynthesis C-methylase UbiE